MRAFTRLLLILCAVVSLLTVRGADTLRPAVLLLPAGKRPDFVYLQELHRKGFDIDYGLSEDNPLTWERLRQFNCLLLTALPIDGRGQHWRAPPYRERFTALLERFQAAGGGVLILLDTYNTTISPYYETHNDVLGKWGAKLPLEALQDPVTERRHPHNRRRFIFTDRILPSPVSAGVSGFWFPCGSHSGNHNYHFMGQPIVVDDTWTVVARGSDSCYSERAKPGFALRENEHFEAFARAGRNPSPVLFAIRAERNGAGRLGLAALNQVLHVLSGTTWAHDRVMLGKGMAKRPGDFGVLIENTLRWLAEPSLKSGALGGYQQNPVILKHPHFRRKPDEFFPEFDSYQNPVPPGTVFRGLVGAQTALSSGQGTVPDYAAAAKRAGLDFVVFLEEFSALTEAELEQLETECTAHSAAALALIAGYTMRTNLGNHIFFFGAGHKYPKGRQLGGKAGAALRVQNFAQDGRLTFSDEAAKNLLWHYTRGPRNIGYFNFANSAPGSVPVRNLRLYGMLGTVTYLDGTLVEDVTDQYLKLTPQGNPPRLCAVDLVKSPAALETAVADGHTLSHVAAENVGGIMAKMIYGHQYGRDNVYASNGPRIHAWAGTQRVMTFAGEPFVTSPYRVPHLVKVSSDIGLRELRIYSDGRLWRRLRLHGEKTFERTFQWSFDRQRGLVLEVIDSAGGRAVSASFETWTDSNAMSWCSDRQNGELWHGPFTIHAAWGSGVLTWHSIGHTWDGGSALTPFAGINLLTAPALWDRTGKSENANGHLPRAMEGYTYATCIDDTVRNLAGEAWNVYAPGVVANAYHTLGPIRPAEQMRYRLRRTMILPRKAGPLLDWHAMWSERKGGGLALFEGEMTILQDIELGQIMPGMLRTINFDDEDRPAIWAVRRDNETPPVCGTLDTIVDSKRYVRAELGRGRSQTRMPIDAGGYVGTFGLTVGTPSALFNVGATPISWEPSLQRLFLDGLPAKAAAGDTFAWRLLYIWDGFEHEARNLARLERIRAYFGIDGGTGSGIEVKRGRLLSHVGLVDLAPDNGLVEFAVPQPDFNLDVPLGLRFIGFNPNWTVAQFQLVGYTTGHYTNGRNVVRNLATDDRDMVHLAVYTNGVPRSHSMVGHPVQCDAPELCIQVTHIDHDPPRWYVAVNNPTDQPIRTTLRKAMDLPGFDLPDTIVDLASGAYKVVLDQTPPPPPKRVSKVEQRPGFLGLVDRDAGGRALRLNLDGVPSVAVFQAGVYTAFTEPRRSTDGKPLRFRVSFEARHLDGSAQLSVCRAWGGSTPASVRLSERWAAYTVIVECDPRFDVQGLLFTLTAGAQTAEGICDIDNVDIHPLAADGHVTGASLVQNGTLDETLDGWTGHALVYQP